MCLAQIVHATGGNSNTVKKNNKIPNAWLKQFWTNRTTDRKVVCKWCAKGGGIKYWLISCVLLVQELIKEHPG